MAIGLTPCRFLLSILFFISCLAHAQPLSKNVIQKIDTTFEKWNRQDSPGCALGIYRDGKIIYQHGYGMANLNDDVPITPETVFHVASMSKQFTAAAIVLLAQQGKLSLDDDVHKYIPELPQFGERITIRHLIHHTSGLRDQWDLLELAGWRYSLDLITDDDVMSVLVRQKDLNFKPGDKELYSNTGYTLLGIIVKRVSGMSLREFTTKNIFIPLGMMHTHFRDDHAEIIKHDALGYTQAGKDKPFQMSLTNFDTVGATSLHTTVRDLQRWDENFYHPRVGGPAFIKQLLETNTLNNGEQNNYAFGLIIGKYKGLQTVDHAGSDAGYRSDMMRFPAQHFSVAVLCNAAAAEPSQFVRQIADIVLAKKLNPMAKLNDPILPAQQKAVTAFNPTTKELIELTGVYTSKEIDPVYHIILNDGQLSLVRPKQKSETLQPVMPDVFTSEIGTIRFMRDTHHQVSGFVLNSDRIRNFRFTAEHHPYLLT